MSSSYPISRAIVNARLLDPATGLDTLGGVLISGRNIADFGAHVTADSIASGVEIIDAKGLCLSPGLVDMRVQLREPGFEHKETLKTGCEAAVSGGVTSMVCLPNTVPVIDDVPLVEFVARRARQIGLAKVYPYAAATKGLAGKELAEMGFLKAAGALAFTDGVKAIDNAGTMRKVLTYAATFDALVVQHAEEPTLATGVMNGGELATRMGLTGSSPEAEVIMLERDMRLVAMTKARYHAAHVSTKAGLEVIKKAKDAGLRVTCDTAPPYFALNELAVEGYRTFAKLSPPLRSDEDRIGVVDAIKAGVVDVIASDHAPQDQESKRQTFASAEFGGVGLETLLAVTLSLYHQGHLGLLDALKLITINPAKLLGLNAGALVKGNAADLVLFDLDQSWVVDPYKFVGKSKNSPFDGRILQGVAVKTLVDGRVVFER